MKRIHGKSNTKLYRIWAHIKERCFNEKTLQYKDYGGRGISMQSEWVNDFLKFEEYVTQLDGYDENNLGNTGLSIDRVDNNQGYYCGNLKWSSRIIQARNRGIKSTNTTGYTGVS